MEERQMLGGDSFFNTDQFICKLTSAHPKAQVFRVMPLALWFGSGNTTKWNDTLTSSDVFMYWDYFTNYSISNCKTHVLCRLVFGVPIFMWQTFYSLFNTGTLECTREFTEVCAHTCSAACYENNCFVHYSTTSLHWLSATVIKPGQKGKEHDEANTTTTLELVLRTLATQNDVLRWL